MSTYIFGDVHGNLRVLDGLLEDVAFGPGDRAIFVGDLVNVGFDSAAVLRRVRDLGPQADTVLGNHDLHMLAVIVAGQKMRSKDTFDDVLRAPDQNDLTEWLLNCPLALTHAGALVVHAGLLPPWDVDQTLELAREVQLALQTRPRDLLNSMYGNEPRRWRDDLAGPDRLRIAINALTRARVLTREGELEYGFKGELQNIPAGHVPWFELTQISTPIYFGHWSALDVHRHGQIVSLDSGCAWGRKLSCVRLEDGKLFQKQVSP